MTEKYVYEVDNPNKSQLALLLARYKYSKKLNKGIIVNTMFNGPTVSKLACIKINKSTYEITIHSKVMSDLAIKYQLINILNPTKINKLKL